MVGRIETIQAGTAALGVFVTTAIIAVPGLSLGYRSPAGHVAVETTAAVIALLAAWVIYGRYRVSRLRGDLLLLLGLIGLAAAAFANLIVVLDRSVGPEGPQAVWIPLALRALADSTLLAAAFSPIVTIASDSARRLSAGFGAAVAGVAAVFGVFSDHLATGVNPGIDPASSSHALITGSPGLIVAQAAILAILVVAALRFGQRARAEWDELLGWVGIALVLIAISRLNYILYPSNFSEWVFTGDLFRLLGYIVLFVGAIRQISLYQRMLAETAVFDERLRISRDLHDGLAQHLSYIVSRGRQLARQDPAVAPLVSAAEEALDDSRGAILAFSRPSDEPLEISVAGLAGMLAGRHGARLALDLDADVRVEPEVRENLLRILSEAISNAVHHGEASELRVALAVGEEVRLTIEDDGGGLASDFNADATHRDAAGLGLSTMRARASRMGGDLQLRTVADRGTRVEVVVPLPGSAT